MAIYKDNPLDPYVLRYLPVVLPLVCDSPQQREQRVIAWKVKRERLLRLLMQHNGDVSKVLPTMTR